MTKEFDPEYTASALAGGEDLPGNLKRKQLNAVIRVLVQRLCKAGQWVLDAERRCVESKKAVERLRHQLQYQFQRASEEIVCLGRSLEKRDSEIAHLKTELEAQREKTKRFQDSRNAHVLLAFAEREVAAADAALVEHDLKACVVSDNKERDEN